MTESAMITPMYKLFFSDIISVYANYIGPSVMTDANQVNGDLYVMIKLLKMTNVS